MIIIIFFLSNMCFVCLKEASPRDVSFTHSKHMLLETFIKVDHVQVIFSESILSEIEFELTSIYKNLSWIFLGFTVF